MEQAHPGNGEEWPAAHVHSFKPSLEMRVEVERKTRAKVERKRVKMQMQMVTMCELLIISFMENLRNE